MSQSKQIKREQTGLGDALFGTRLGEVRKKPEYTAGADLFIVDNSDSYDWLVIAGAKAQYKGVGTINGAGAYRFMLTAIDGDLLAGGKGSDKFRMKIWSDNGLIYDNQVNAPDTDEPTTVIGGGNIVIHK